MDSLSFAFGALAMFAVALTVIVVVGVVRVMSLGKSVSILRNDLYLEEQRVNSNIEEVHRMIDDRVREVDESSRDLFSEAKAYTDSRFDKLNVTGVARG